MADKTLVLTDQELNALSDFLGAMMPDKYEVDIGVISKETLEGIESLAAKVKAL